MLTIRWFKQFLNATQYRLFKTLLFEDAKRENVKYFISEIYFLSFMHYSIERQTSNSKHTRIYWCCCVLMFICSWHWIRCKLFAIAITFVKNQLKNTTLALNWYKFRSHILNQYSARFNIQLNEFIKSAIRFSISYV